MEIIVIVVIVFIFLIFFKRNRHNNKPKNLGPFPAEWKTFLQTKIEFYRELTEAEKFQFEKRLQHFISTIQITGIDTNVEDKDKLLVAASAIIPVFAFPNWEYPDLREVLLYPASFNEKFIAGESDSLIQGMVGTGYMEGKMILSKPALHLGFTNHEDKKNVGIHEFVHLIDKADGEIDGIPRILMNREFALPWMELVRQKMEKIYALDSDINPYGGVDKREFFSVIAEYFFERPKLLKRKHPELYKHLNAIFTSNLAEKYRGAEKKREINRNDPCPCGSGKKYKYCCGSPSKQI
jgi:Mlc titration factor MtfA (ptsG expression regulator)